MMRWVLAWLFLAGVPSVCAEQRVIPREGRPFNLAQFADEVETALGKRLSMGLNGVQLQIDDFDQLTPQEKQQVLSLVDSHQAEDDLTYLPLADRKRKEQEREIPLSDFGGLAGGLAGAASLVIVARKKKAA